MLVRALLVASVRVFALAVLIASTTVALAGAFFEQSGVAIRGYDAVAYFTQGKPVKGSPAFATDYQGSTFHFSSAAHRDAFIADPAKYAPQYGGYCAFGTSRGYKAAIEPSAFTVVDGKLYLNYNRDIQQQWSRDIAGHVRTADRNWPEVSKQTKVVQ